MTDYAIPVALMGGLMLALLYLAMWGWWVLPRLVALRREALVAHYRVPAGLWAAYVAAEAAAPLTAVVVTAWWLRGRWERFLGPSSRWLSGRALAPRKRPESATQQRGGDSGGGS